MRIALALGVVLLTGVAWIPAHAALESLVLYDNFDKSLINPDKWFGSEGPFGGEATRLLQGGRLRMTYRAYGNTTTNVGQTLNGNRLHFVNPAAVTAIKATVIVKGVALTGCSLNPAPTDVRARLIGFFFNTGTPTPGSSTNDVIARIIIFRRSNSTDPPGVLKVQAFVGTCDNPACSSATNFSSLDFGTVATDVSTTVSVQWDRDNHQFIFTRDATAIAAPYTVSDSAPPGTPNKLLDSGVFVPNCTAAPLPTGFVDASFDDVFVNVSAAIR